MKIYNIPKRFYDNISESKPIPKYWNRYCIIDAEYEKYKGEELPDIETDDNYIIKSNLRLIDLKTIRSLREWLMKQADCPEYIKEHESEAEEERKKLKP